MKRRTFGMAALTGTKVVATSVTASTITTVVVYLPQALLDGLAGQLFSQLGFTIIIAMISSLVVALTLIPIFFWKYKPKEKKDLPVSILLDKVGKGYKWLLGKIMLKKKRVMLVAVALLILAFYLAGQLNMELIPQTGMDNVKISIEQRSGTRMEIVDADVQFIEQMIIGDSDFSDCSITVSDASATITAYPADGCKKSVNELVEEYNMLLKDYTNMTITVEAAGGGGIMPSTMSVGTSTEVVLSGEDMDDLKAASKQVEAAMMGIPGVIKTANSLSSDASQAKIEINPLKCMDVALPLYRLRRRCTAQAAEPR